MIELLVVVSIIALLIALLIPALGSARESARKVQCLANINQLAIASHAFAADNKGQAPPGSDNGLSAGMYAVWPGSDTWGTGPLFERYGKYRRVGVIMTEGYSQTPEILYCPSMTDRHAWLAPGKTRPSGVYAGWFDEHDRPAGISIINMSYHYRETYRGSAYEAGASYDKSELSQTLNFHNAPSDLVMLADAFSDPTRGLSTAHKDGYNFVRLDGSGSYYLDRGSEIDQLNEGNRFNTNRLLVERSFESFRWGTLVGDDLVKP